MTTYEYKVVPAPKRGLKAKGIKGNDARFANALQTVMNEYGADGWEYQRTDTLPAEERQGLTGRTTVFQNMLVFRRAIPAEPTAPVDAVSTIAAPVVMPSETTNTPELVASREDAVQDALTSDQPDAAEIETVVENAESDEKTVAAE